MGQIFSRLNNFLFPKPDIDILLENYKYKIALDKIEKKSKMPQASKFFTTFYPN